MKLLNKFEKKGKIIKKFGSNPSSNGCGSYLITINLSNYNILNGFNACCNLHDICYNDCFSNKKVCDTNFYDCLKIAATNRNETHFKKSSNIIFFNQN